VSAVFGQPRPALLTVGHVGQVRAGLDGIVLYVVATPPISQGQPVAFIGAPKR